MSTTRPDQDQTPPDGLPLTTTRRHRRRKQASSGLSWWLLPSAAALAVAAWWLLTVEEITKTKASIAAANHALVGTEAAQIGQELQEGDVLRIGPQGHCQLQWPDRSAVLMYANSAATWRDEHLDLAIGRLYAKVQPQEKPDFRIDIPAGTVQVLGTDFFIDVSKQRNGIQVHDGLVRLNTDAQQVDIAAGQLLDTSTRPLQATEPGPALTGFTVIDCRSGEALPSHPRLQDGDKLPAGQFQLRELSVFANYTRFDIAKVVFTVTNTASGEVTMITEEDNPPYSINSEQGLQDIRAWRPTAGTYQLTAVPYGHQSDQPMDAGLRITLTLE